VLQANLRVEALQINPVMTNGANCTTRFAAGVFGIAPNNLPAAVPYNVCVASTDFLENKATKTRNFSYERAGSSTGFVGA
jgi:hypothetical protein